MSKQWVRQEIKKNEIADSLTRVSLWIERNRQATLAAAGAVLGAALIALFFLYRSNQTKNAAWEKLAIAQSQAYQGQKAAAMEQIRTLETEFAHVPASGFGMLFAADLLYREGKFKEAVEIYQRLLDRQGPQSLIPIALSDLGMSQEAGGDCQGAVSTHQRFLDAHQDHFLAPQAHASLARCLEILGQGDKAKAAYERMALLYPNTYWAQWAQSRVKS